jgi:phosphatidylglycerol---prolipoprotein diacylglyceryl transferase
MTYPTIDPVLIHLGPLQIRWYGLMYVIAFVLAYIVLIKASRRRGYDLTRQDVGDFLTYAIVGVIVGARLGFCVFYNFAYYAHHPLKVFAVWEGGMSFHGGLIGVFVGGWLYTRKSGKSYLVLGDLAALAAPLGLFFGRMGNFINAELYGRVTDVPWAMVFPDAGPLPRHPSQLYEAFFEGLVLFVLLFLLSRRKTPNGFLLAAFLVGYGFFRFFLEFFREPDPQMGFVLGPLTMGQVLCIVMVIAGIGLFRISSKARPRIGS